MKSKLADYEDAFNNVPKLKAIFLFFFSKPDFLRLSVKHDIGLNLSIGNKRERFVEGQYRPDERQETDLASKRTDYLRRSLLHSFSHGMVTVLSAIYIGALLSEAFGAPLLKITRGLQVVGAGLLLWATLWELGWGFRSWVGESLPERVHRWIFRGFYILGTFCLFLSVTW
jgi:hypothetical protein